MTVILTKEEVVQMVLESLERKGYSVPGWDTPESKANHPYWDADGRLVLELTMEDAG